jgi:hypothetical protein
MKNGIIFLFSCFSLLAFSQKSIILSDELKEISGLQYLNDTLLVAHNDGGNAPMIYFLNPNSGKIIKRVILKNTKNVDWEDMALNGNYLYIGDFGNNNNKRKNLTIYRFSWKDALKQDSISTDLMTIAYADQMAFPPENKALNFDAECLAFADGYLWIFTKNRTVPFDGVSNVYRVKFQENTHAVLKKEYSIKIGSKGWMFDSVTGGDFAYGYFYLTTYNRILKYLFSEGKFTLVKQYKYNEYNQKEAITVIKDDQIYVANEFQKVLGKQKLYRISLKK